MIHTFQNIALDQLFGRGTHRQPTDETRSDRLLGLLELIIGHLMQDVAIDEILLVRSQLKLQGQGLLPGQLGQPGVVVVVVPVDDMSITLIAIAATLPYHKWPRILLIFHRARQLDVEHLLPAVG